ncbi:hypothetical protein B0H19DRAFT_1065280 [Mycena capillaripes]|nr:hypothetical protein B0H19DRAFT_1065280 [Mycena capillaripes]
MYPKMKAFSRCKKGNIQPRAVELKALALLVLCHEKRSYPTSDLKSCIYNGLNHRDSGAPRPRHEQSNPSSQIMLLEWKRRSKLSHCIYGEIKQGSRTEKKKKYWTGSRTQGLVQTVVFDVMRNEGWYFDTRHSTEEGRENRLKKAEVRRGKSEKSRRKNTPLRIPAAQKFVGQAQKMHSREEDKRNQSCQTQTEGMQADPEGTDGRRFDGLMDTSRFGRTLPKGEEALKIILALWLACSLTGRIRAVDSVYPSATARNNK